MELVVIAGGNALARGPHENPINDDAELVESKGDVDKDECRTYLMHSLKLGQNLAG